MDKLPNIVFVIENGFEGQWEQFDGHFATREEAISVALAGMLYVKGQGGPIPPARVVAYHRGAVAAELTAHETGDGLNATVTDPPAMPAAEVLN